MKSLRNTGSSNDLLDNDAIYGGSNDESDGILITPSKFRILNSSLNPLMLPAVPIGRRQSSMQVTDVHNHLKEALVTTSNDPEQFECHEVISIFIEAMSDGYLQCEEFLIQKPPLGKLTCNTAMDHIRSTFSLSNGYLVQQSSLALTQGAGMQPQYVKVHPQTFLRSGVQYKFVDAIVQGSEENVDVPNSAPTPESLAKDPVCKCTQERIIQDHPTLNGCSMCPFCMMFSLSCPIAFHPMGSFDGVREVFKLVNSISDMTARISSLANSITELEALKALRQKELQEEFQKPPPTPIVQGNCNVERKPDISQPEKQLRSIRSSFIRISNDQTFDERQSSLFALLDKLEMDSIPNELPSGISTYEIDDFYVETNVNFTWNWENEFEVVSSTLIKKLCASLQSAGLNAVDLTTGNHVLPSGIYNSSVWSLRKKTSKGVNRPIVFLGQLSGSPPIVVVTKKLLPNEVILRHSIICAVAVFNSSTFRTDIRQCFTEAAIHLIGLCADNMNSSPVVALTDCNSYYFLLSLVVKCGDPLQFGIDINPCVDFQSLLHLMKCIGSHCRSYDFGRPPSPTFAHSFMDGGSDGSDNEKDS